MNFQVLLLTRTRLFLIVVIKLSEMPLLRGVETAGAGEDGNLQPILLSTDDDLELCLYYLRILYHVILRSGEVSAPILATKRLSFNGSQIQISSMFS